MRGNGSTGAAITAPDHATAAATAKANLSCMVMVDVWIYREDDIVCAGYTVDICNAHKDRL